MTFAAKIDIQLPKVVWRICIVKENTVSALKIPRQISASALVLASSALLLACQKPVPKTEDVRPVRVLKLDAQTVERSSEFSGEVRPRIESRLGFRVPGKILLRKVEVGDVVKRGQLLMELDPTDLQLAQTQTRAALVAAESNRDLAKADLARYQDLFNNKFVSKAVLDARDTAYKSAQASVEQAQAGLKNSANQSGYTRLLADMDGVVVAIDAEAGQVVGAGTPVLRLARPDQKEVVFGIPEDRVDVLRALPEVQVRLWADPKKIMNGKIREISPQADPTTRTYAARVTLPTAGPEVKLGMTAYVSYARKTAQPVIKVPLSAMYQEKNITSLWVVDKGVAQLVPVKVAGVSGNDVLIASGVTAGQQVVTAGVHVLKPGQKVKILDADLTQANLESQATAAHASAEALSVGAGK
jgi:RND family efflux transporter MFP subunit